MHIYSASEKHKKTKKRISYNTKNNERRIPGLKQKIFKGACTALITPFKNGKIDYAALDRIIEFQLEQGISALLVSGTTGESPVLSYHEHKNLIRHAAKRIGGRVPLIAGTGSNDTEKAVKMTKYADEYGADACLCVTPYYNKTSQQGLVHHYERIALSCNKPIIVYNVPARTGVNILPETYKALGTIDNICAIKEASPNVSDAAYTKSLCPELDIYCGNDDLLLPHLSIGASGIISVMSNIFPQISSQICSLYFSGNTGDSYKLYSKYLHFSRLLFCDVNPIPIKFIMSYAGFCTDNLRLPLVAPSESTKKILVTEYNKLKKC